MSNKLGGGFRGQSYMGTKADSPPNMIVEDRAPTIYDINYELGDLWEHKYIAGGLSQQDVYMLVNLEGTTTSKGELATWALLGSGAGDLTHLTGDDGVVVQPLGGNINVVGDNVNLFTRSTVANQLEVYYVGQPGESFTTNAGSAIPAAATGILNVFGGTNMATRATGVPPSDTILIDMTPNIELIGWVYSHDKLYSDLGAQIYAGGLTVDAGGINATGPIVLPSLVGPGFLHASALGAITVSTGAGGAGGWLPISNAAGAIVWGQIQPGSANITITNAGNVITIDSTAGGFAGLIADDTNTADPDVNQKVIVAGGTLIATTSVVLNTLTVSLEDAAAAASPQVIYAPLAGGAGAWGRIDVAGGATIAEAGGVITITAGAGGAGFGGLIDDAAAVAAPDANARVTIAGGTLIETDATIAPNTVTVSIPDAPVVATPQLIYAPAAGGAGAWGRFAAAGGATVAEAGGVITITAGAGGAGGAVILHTDGADASIDVGDSSFDIVGGNLIETAGATDTVTVSLTQGTSGYVPIGKTGLDPVWGQILGGTQITVDLSVAGEITINSTAVEGLTDLTGNVGAATQDVTHNINLVGVANQIVSTGAFSTMALSISPTLVLPGSLTISALNHVGIMMTDGAGLVSSLAPGIDGSIPISNGAGVVAWGAIQQGPGSVTVTNAGGVITIGGGGGVSAGARFFDTNVGAAEAAVTVHPSPSIYILGGENINTSGGTDTVVVNLNHSVILPMTTVDSLSGVIGIGTTMFPGLPADRFISSYGTRNTYVGHASGRLDVTATGLNNVGIGNNVLDALTTGSYNTGCGSSSLGSLDVGGYNTAAGASSMILATSSVECTALGYASQAALLTGNYNTSAGSNSMRHLTTGADNCAFGYNALHTAVTSSDSVAIGSGALRLSTADGNVAIGKSAGAAIVASTGNTMVGFNSGLLLTGHESTFVGCESGDTVTTGDDNLLIGRKAGYSLAGGIGLTTGSNNLFIGNYGGSPLNGALCTYSNRICIGNGAHAGGTGSIVIGDDIVVGGQTSLSVAGVWGRIEPLEIYSRVVLATTSANQITGMCKLRTADAAGNQGAVAGQVLIGGALGPRWNTISNGFGITVTNTDNNISISRSEGDIVAFLAYHNGTNNNLTGAGGTVWFGTWRTLTEITDSHGAFFPGNSALGTQATFTAPYTGLYAFTIQIYYVYTAPPVPPPAPVVYYDPIIIENITTGRSYEQNMPFITTNPADQTGCYTVVTKLALNNVVRFGFSATLDPAGLRLGVAGSNETDTYISGYLVKQL
jgi:hypothetical protein